VNIQGLNDGIVRPSDAKIAYLKLQTSLDFPKLYQSNRKKLLGSKVTIEGMTMKAWEKEYRAERIISQQLIERERNKGSRLDGHAHSSSHSASSPHQLTGKLILINIITMKMNI